MYIDDTIAAVSSPRGKGGVALIRISGSEAVSIADRVFRPKSGRPPSTLPQGQMAYGGICMRDPETDVELQIDDGMCVVFRAPHSFTGEDTVELSCHGGMLVTEAVLSAVLAAGARPAEAGEFTRRAFIGGKMKLSEAEALGTLLEAKTYSQLALSRSGMEGRLSRRVEELAGRLRHLLASIYVKIDYPDEDLADRTDAEVSVELSAILEGIRTVAATYRTGHATMEGIETVICGPTNAGKSSLYNAILGKEAAIVTDIAGTTRDILTETVAMGRVTLRLYDTAGLRETEDRVEQIGIARAKEAIAGAELILAVFDGSIPPDPAALSEIAYLRGVRAERDVPIIVLLNKADKGSVPEWEAHLASFTTRVLRVSLEREEADAIARLSGQIVNDFTDGAIDLRSDAVVANARQYAALARSTEAISRAIDAIGEGLSADLYCLDAEAALMALEELDGRTVSESIVSEIFSHFCVGK